MIKYKDRKLIKIIDTACPCDQNSNAKVNKNLQKYQQLAYKTRESCRDHPKDHWMHGRRCNKLKEHIARVLKTNENKMTDT